MNIDSISFLSTVLATISVMGVSFYGAVRLFAARRFFRACGILAFIPQLTTRVIACLLLTSAAGADSLDPKSDYPPASYGDDFADRYSVVEDSEPSILDGLPVEDTVVTHSPLGAGVAKVERTLGTEVPYDRSVALVTVEHRFGDPVYLVSTGFRTIAVTWIGERYVRLDKGIGRIVSIEEIYDLLERRWLVQHTVSYHVR